MGLDQSKSSRQARTNIIDFPTRNSRGNRKDLDYPTQLGAQRQPPALPPRTSSFARPTVGEYESSSSSRGAAAHAPRDQLYREKSIRSCLSWDKETSTARSHFPQKTGMFSEKKTESPAVGKYPKGTCDKCDGAHLTDDCPIYKKKRDDHPDAWRNFGKKSPLEMGKGGCAPKTFNLSLPFQVSSFLCSQREFQAEICTSHSTAWRWELLVSLSGIWTRRHICICATPRYCGIHTSE